MLLSLRARLILPLAAASLIVIGAFAWDFFRDREHQIAAAKEVLLSETKLIAARQQAITSHADAILNGLMSSPSLREGASSEACSGELAQRQMQEAQFSNIIKASPNGDLLCSAQPMVGAINVADRDYFQEALKRRAMVVGGVITGRVEGKRSIAFAKAMHGEIGRVVGVLILTLDLDWLSRELAPADLPAGARLVVVDAKGNVAARFPAHGAWIGASVAGTELFQSIHTAGGAGTVEGHDLQGERRLFAHATLLETVSGPMYVWQSVPMAIVTAPAERESLIKLGGAAGALLAAMGVLIWGANRFLVRPVAILARTAERLSTEGAGARSGLPHDGTELGKLALALDGATSAIAEREQRLVASEQRFRRLNELSSDWIWERDEELRLTYVSPSYLKLSGVRAEEIIGKSFGEYFEGDDRSFAAPLLAREAFRDVESSRRRPDGTQFWRSISGEPVFDESGNFKGFRGTGRDITAKREATERLRQSEERFRRLNALAVDWIWERDENMRLTYLSPSYYELTGAAPGAMLGTGIEEFERVRGDEETRGAYVAAIRARRAFRDHVYARHDPDGAFRWRSLSGEPVFDESGAFKGYRGTGRDVTERKHHEAELRRQATTDALTGLPNRTLLRDRLKHALERAGRRQQAVAVMMLDLDDFNHVIDAIGHEAGDALLRVVAERLHSCVRPEDTVARVSGDEFVVVLENLESEDSVKVVADRIRDAIAAQCVIAGKSLRTGASIGIALFPRDGADATTLLRNADAAMYQARGLGGGSIQFFTQALNDRAARYIELRADLQTGFERGEFELHYQPIFGCRDEGIVGAEALLRWRRTGTLVAPGEFLDVAEDSDLIVPIGAWALREACAYAQAWPARGAAAPYVAVNLSARQFRHGDLVDTVRTVIGDTGLAPERLVLELTETTMMSDLDAAAEVLGRIEALGVRVAIDDFGTGHSSLAYLKRLPVSELKIDRCFVQDAPTDADDASIVRAVIDLAHALGMDVVAEGVETSEQVALLRRLGCDRMQGFLLGRPMPASEFEALLDA